MKSVLLFWIIAGLLALAGCMPSLGPDPRQSAQMEATQIILQAQSTAMLVKAQAEATAIVLSAQNSMAASPTPDVRFATAQPSSPSSVEATPTITPTIEPGRVELLGVGFAADGALIIVQFKASPQITQFWQQGNVSVTNEATAVVYNEVPIYPSIGPLFARPKLEGQAGYFMLVNPEPQLRSSDIVTVIMGDFKFENVKVE